MIFITTGKTKIRIHCVLAAPFPRSLNVTVAPCWWCCALQAAATRSGAASPEARRRSCSWTGVASWGIPRGTQAATRATRTWRTVMTAWPVCDHLSSSASSFTSETDRRGLQFFFMLEHSRSPNSVFMLFWKDCAVASFAYDAHFFSPSIFFFLSAILYSVSASLNPMTFLRSLLSHLFQCIWELTYSTIAFLYKSYLFIVVFRMEERGKMLYPLYYYWGTGELTHIILHWAVISYDLFSETCTIYM